MTKEYLRMQYYNTLLDHKLGKPGAIDELARIVKTATVFHGFDFADELMAMEIRKED